jgi:FkbM family methyltransferase
MSLRRTTKAWLRPIYRRLLKPIYSTLRRPFGNDARREAAAAASAAATEQLLQTAARHEAALEQLLQTSARHEAALRQALAALGQLPRLEQMPQPAAALEQLQQAAARHEAALQQVLAALSQLPRLDQLPPPAVARDFSRAVYVGQERLLCPHPALPFMYLDAQDPLVAPRVALDLYEPGVTAALKRLLRPGDVAVEGGANQGYHTVTMAALVLPKGGKVVSVEPNPRAFAILQDTILGLGLRDIVTLYQKAAYHKQATLQLHLGRSTAWSNLFYSPGSGTTEVEGVRLGDLLRELGLRPNFVRLDVEGAEPQALEGMWEYLEAVPDIRLLFEFFPGLISAAKYITPVEFLERLRRIGFKFWLVGDDGALTAAEPSRVLDVAANAWVDLAAARELP